MPTPHPPDPIRAVTHFDPYPYYAGLVVRQPLYFDERLELWVASSAGAVTAILSSDLCRVRPPVAPVPEALLGSPAGEIFQALVRMNDGPAHARLKPAVAAALGSLSAVQIGEHSRQWARALAGPIQPDGRSLAGFALRLPVHVLGSLLGIPRERLAQVSAWIGDFVRCLAPASSAGQIERGKAAAGHLLDLFRSQAEGPAAGLMAGLVREARRAGVEEASAAIANGLGFLSQAYEATAGLIGSTLNALRLHADVRERVRADPGLLEAVIQEVLRWDPPVQNTRRFVALPGTVAGQAMRAGDGILVVLAAANRDPSANPDPDRFDPSRESRKIFTFGHGSHACPGEALAAAIARGGIEHLLAAGLEPGALPGPAAYRASANTRIPLWAAEDTV